MTLTQRFPNAPQNYDAQNEAQFRNIVRQALADASSPIIMQEGVGQSFGGVAGDLIHHNGSEFVAATTFTGNYTFSGTTIFSANVTLQAGLILTNPTTVTGTWANLGTVTTVDINGGTIDGTPINASAIGQTTPAAGRFSTLAATNGGTLYGGGGFGPTFILGRANASSASLVITDHDGLAHTWLAFSDGNNYITASEEESAGANGATYFRNFVGGAYNNHVTIGNYGIDIVDGNLALPDDGTINFGAAPDYSFLYRTSTTAFEFWTTNADGAGTDGKIFEVVDGDDMIRFFGEIIATNTGTLYDAPTAGFFPTAQFGRLNNAAAASLLLTNAAGAAHSWLGYADGNNYVTADETASGGAAAATIFRNYTAGGGGTYTEYGRFDKTGLTVVGLTDTDTLDTGAVKLGQQTITAATDTLVATDCVVLVDASSNDITITLPTAAAGDRVVYWIKRIDTTANTVTIDGNGTETIDNNLTITLTTMDAITITSDGTEWWIL